MNTPSQFSPTLPTFQLAWDSTSLGTFKECARKYYFQHIIGFATRFESIHLKFGQLFHSGVELYDKSIAEGLDHDSAVYTVTEWSLRETWNPETQSPLEVLSFDPIKNRHTLIRSLIWACEERLTSPFKTLILPSGKPAVELSFRFEAFSVGSETITFCGHLDRVVLANSQPWIEDHKTTKGALNSHYFDGFTPGNQFSLYTIAGKIVTGSECRGVIVNGVQIGTGFTRFAHAQAPRPRAVLDEWLADARYWITQARAMAEANNWPGNDKSCGNYGGCPFQKVCSVSPSHRLAHLQSDFVPFHWNPLEIR
jgi:hypothetical protein